MFSVFKHLQWLSYKTPYKGKLKEVLIVCNYNLDKTVLVSLPKYLLLIDLTVLINTSVFNFASTCEEFEKKIMQHIPKNYQRGDLLADGYKNKAFSQINLSNSLKLILAN